MRFSSTAAAAAAAVISFLNIGLVGAYKNDDKSINRADFSANHPFNQPQPPVKLLLRYTKYLDGEPEYKVDEQEMKLIPAGSGDSETGHLDSMRGEIRFSHYRSFTSAEIIGKPTDADYQYCAFRVKPFEDKVATDDEKLGARLLYNDKSLNPGGYGIVCFAYWRDFEEKEVSAKAQKGHYRRRRY